MNTAVTAKREVGRPRTFEDEAIFQATTKVLNRVGHERLTLSAIAVEVGCSAPALVQRFGSRNALLLQFLKWSNQRSRERFLETTKEHDSPLTALRARICMPANERPDEIGDGSASANLIGFYLVAWQDEELRQHADERRQIFEDEFQQLLAEAQTRGELRPCNERDLAHMLLCAILGVTFLWVGNPIGQIEDRMGEMFDTMVAPYRT